MTETNPAIRLIAIARQATDNLSKSLEKIKSAENISEYESALKNFELAEKEVEKILKRLNVQLNIIPGVVKN